MGCCVSTNGSSTKDRDFQLGSADSLKHKSTLESRAPPPSVEEETVKEVLSETPKLKPIKNSQPQQHHHEETHNKSKIHIEQAFLDEKIKPNGFKNELVAFQEEEIYEQEVSEVCSLSETVSTTTFNNDKRDEEYDDDDDGRYGEEVKQRVKRSPVVKLPPRNRSVSGDFGPKRDRIVGKSPNRRTEQSPNKRNNAGGGAGSVSLVQSKESGIYQAGRNGLRPDQKRKDPGESSGRRSRSPATNRSVTGRSRSARRTIASPDRVKTELPENGGSNMEEGHIIPAENSRRKYCFPVRII
ncbi:hypothetical protein JCGZ_21385 [Jatropha curcas]|uniref:Uncharacterized protein n=1 Tax=Jatropha curcas TaxID=180498 RepID=A0A067JN19_JATCU|nr:hypothetical protein JCGZ_21385 [Jatropha curcas]